MVTTVDCPTCGRKVPFTPASRWRPFCSARCKTVDLGGWASDSYRIAGDPVDESSVPDDSSRIADDARPADDTRSVGAGHAGRPRRG